ncbi:MAG: pantetheine-phosphate adenylyltransferase [Clostridia bacterium]|jgi:pantetheine-phosphate adenylyltransferase, bacterial|nr:pantetheine-phosphate adenylyltransferase [Oscillospiraceae bacterium]MBQ2016816.1 pantetheine-phosphate adenylyltransferase [Clostridia bacterium]MBQ2692564.1 pantetheine-phosphate adenylyltransferase [Clostridia bacterium]MBQ3050952.1 pantetheine-phosphate adenylyltransferase [Clostridia bacterium]MBQ3327075.1 pantetheine-phosphate adenylyltransferase [Clostridia bacterium]
MKTAICPGSFDPVTNGHLDVIERASKIFDEVYVVVMTNYQKIGSTTFTEAERVDLIERSIGHLPNVRVDTYSGLLADYAAEHDIHIIVKGLRAVSDFENEFQQSIANKHINNSLETVFLPSSENHMFLSSSFIKQIGQLGGDISDFVPEPVRDDIIKRLRKE